MKLQREGKSIENFVPGENDYVAVSQGFCLDLTGHYGGFTDDLEGSSLSRVILCHDCSLSLARALPGIFKPGSGHHSMFYDEAHTSCCEFGWTSVESQVLVGDRKGNWVPEKRQHA